MIKHEDQEVNGLKKLNKLDFEILERKAASESPPRERKREMPESGKIEHFQQFELSNRNQSGNSFKITESKSDVIRPRNLLLKRL